MDELLGQFLIEGRDLIAEGHAALDAFGSDANDAAALDAAFRAVHTLKGSVAIFGLTPAERLLHMAEDVLGAARSGTRFLDADTRERLVDCLDQTDRWIDEVEQTGAIGNDGEDKAGRLIEALSAEAVPAATGARELLVAFRYEPDADCFFRGEDPLALAAAVPDLRSLAVEPSGAWPSLGAWDPFRCIMVIEGVSGAPIDDVRAAFRLAPDQVQIEPVAQGALPADPANAPTKAADTVRIATGRLDALAEGFGELIVASNAASELAAAAEGIDREFAARLRLAQAGVDRAIAGLGRTVTAMRRVPLKSTLGRLPRVVREIGASVGKPLRLEIIGDVVEVDKQIADAIYEPLLHLLRNAADHGVETAEARRAAGKPAEGRLEIHARREGDDVVIALTDDGAGIDVDAVRQHATARGNPDAEAMDDARALQLIFAPGFSTAATISEVSGRGVGMDAVRTAVERLRGGIEIETKRGAGTTFRMRLPASAITTRLLLVKVGSERYGVPLDQISETIRLSADDLKKVGGGTACVHRGHTLPVLDLSALLGQPGEDGTGLARLLVTHATGEALALRVGSFGARIDAVVRRRSGILAGITGISGTTVLGNGEVLLVLDLAELAA